jgi:hypothetical protein
VFLAELERNGGNVHAAADVAGVGRSTVYDHRGRDEAFEAAVRRALVPPAVARQGGLDVQTDADRVAMVPPPIVGPDRYGPPRGNVAAMQIRADLLGYTLDEVLEVPSLLARPKGGSCGTVMLPSRELTGEDLAADGTCPDCLWVIPWARRSLHDAGQDDRLDWCVRQHLGVTYGRSPRRASGDFWGRLHAGQVA